MRTIGGRGSYVKRRRAGNVVVVEGKEQKKKKKKAREGHKTDQECAPRSYNIITATPPYTCVRV